MTTPEPRQELVARLHRLFARMMRDDDPEETPGYQSRQVAQRRPFYMADQMEDDDV